MAQATGDLVPKQCINECGNAGLTRTDGAIFCRKGFPKAGRLVATRAPPRASLTHSVT